MLFDTFYMGNVPDPGLIDSFQVGIKLNQQLAGFSLEENTFVGSTGNVDIMIGISAENLGEMNNFIRKNTFSGLDLANEAFGRNGNTNDELNGLRYICNVNSSTTDKDFFIKDSYYGIDNVSILQADFAGDGSLIATGNEFSSTGDQDDGDFANYGVEIDEYHYYASSAAQVPDAVDGITSTVPALTNDCGQNYCAPPCLSGNDLADLRHKLIDF